MQLTYSKILFGVSESINNVLNGLLSLTTEIAGRGFGGAGCQAESSKIARLYHQRLTGAVLLET